MSTFTDTVTEMWDTRPPRIPKDQGGHSFVAGVCEGIGARYQIDPTIVRIAFVVTSLAVGGGVTAYLLAWMCMPRYGTTVAPVQHVIAREPDPTDQARRERRTGWTLLVFFVLLSGFLFYTFTDFLGSTAIVAIVLLLLAWYGLHQRMPHPPAGLLPSATEVAAPVNLSGYVSAAPTVQPPAWDPLGAAPFAWDLPEPPPRPEPAKRSNTLWWVLGGFGATALVGLLLTGGAAVLFMSSSGPGQEYANPVSASGLNREYVSDEIPVRLDLTGLPTLREPSEVTVTAADHDATVILPDHVPVDVRCDDAAGSECTDGLVNPGATGEPLTLTLVDGDGDGRIILLDSSASEWNTVYRPTTEGDLDELYSSDVGPVTVDFSSLPPLQETRVVEIDHGIGPLRVIPPAGPYELNCDDGIGDSDCVDGSYQDDADGERLIIDVDGGIGPVEVVSAR